MEEQLEVENVRDPETHCKKKEEKTVTFQRKCEKLGNARVEIEGDISSDVQRYLRYTD